jgi:hypothetical protein
MSRLLLIIVLSVAFFISVFSMIRKKKIRIYEMIIAISCISILSIDMVFNFIRTPREKLSNETIEIIQETDWSDSAYLSRIGFELYDNTYKLEKRYDDGFFVIYVEDYSDSDLPNLDFKEYNDHISYAYYISGEYDSPFSIKPVSVSRLYYFIIEDKVVSIREHSEENKLFESFIYQTIG